MSQQKRLHEEVDPDYQNDGDQQAKRQRALEVDAKQNVSKKIHNIIRSEFQREINSRENELLLIDQRLNEARVLMDRLRACIVANYYGTANKATASTQAMSMNAPPASIHPAVKKLIGKRPLHQVITPESPIPSTSQTSEPEETDPSHVNLSAQKSSRTNVPAQEVPSTHLSTAQTQSSQDSSSVAFGKETAEERIPPICSEAGPSRSDSVSQFTAGSVSNRSSPSVSRSSTPSQMNTYGEESFDDRRSRFKIKKKVIIGNVSKYIPVDQREANDHSSHKWMLYVRGPKSNPDISSFIKKVWVFLHHSYKPNDLVEIGSSPFHLTRRGWGEFPVRVQLHFVDPRNKRVDIIHHLKLDKTFSGLQTLGAETVVEVELEKDFFENPQTFGNSTSLSTTDKDRSYMSWNASGNRFSPSMSLSESGIGFRPLQSGNRTLRTSLSGTRMSSTHRKDSAFKSKMKMANLFSKSDDADDRSENSDNDENEDEEKEGGEEEERRIILKKKDKAPESEEELDVGEECNVTIAHDEEVAMQTDNGSNVLDKQEGLTVSSSDISQESSNLEASCSTAPSNTSTTTSSVPTTTSSSLAISSATGIAPVISSSPVQSTTLTTSVVSTVITPSFISAQTTQKLSGTQKLGSPIVSIGNPQKLLAISKTGNVSLLKTQGSTLLSQPLSSKPQKLISLIPQQLTTNSDSKVSKPGTVVVPSLVASNLPRTGSTVKPSTSTTSPLSLSFSSTTTSVSLSSASNQSFTVVMAPNKQAASIAASPKMQILPSTNVALPIVSFSPKGATVLKTTRIPAPVIPQQSLDKPLQVIYVNPKQGANPTIVAGKSLLSTTTISPSVPPPTKQVSLLTGRVVTASPTAGSSSHLKSAPQSLLTGRTTSLLKAQSSIVTNAGGSAEVKIEIPSPGASGSVRLQEHSVDGSKTSVSLLNMTSLLSKSNTLKQFPSSQQVTAGNLLEASLLKTQQAGFALHQSSSSGSSDMLAPPPPQPVKMSAVGITKYGRSRVVSALPGINPDLKTPEQRKQGQYEILMAWKRHQANRKHEMNETKVDLSAFPVVDFRDRIDGEAEQIPLLELGDYPDMQSLTKAAMKLHPLVKRSVNKITHPYCATSMAQWNQWPIGKQRASEWHRACFARRFIIASLKGASEFKGQSVMRTRELVDWGRRHGFSPVTFAVNSENDQDTVKADLDASSSMVFYPSAKPVSHVSTLTPVNEVILGQSSRVQDESGQINGTLEVEVENIETCDKAPEVEKSTKNSFHIEEILLCPNSAFFVTEWLRKRGIKLGPVSLEDGIRADTPAAMLYKAAMAFSADILREAVGLCASRKSQDVQIEDVEKALTNLPSAAFCRSTHLGKEKDEMSSLSREGGMG